MFAWVRWVRVQLFDRKICDFRFMLMAGVYAVFVCLLDVHRGAHFHLGEVSATLILFLCKDRRENTCPILSALIPFRAYTRAVSPHYSIPAEPSSSGHPAQVYRPHRNSYSISKMDRCLAAP
jgi:hypothetical protein